MSRHDKHLPWREEQESRDRIRIIKDLKKGRFASALRSLSHYSTFKRSSLEDSEDTIGEYFVLLHSAYAHFRLDQPAEAKACLEKILFRQPLEGQANLFLAYIHLLENHKTEAIHRYTILLENPFYRSQATKILDRIRHSENMSALLGEISLGFFYQHRFPSIFWKEWNSKIKQVYIWVKDFLLKNLSLGLLLTKPFKRLVPSSSLFNKKKSPNKENRENRKDRKKTILWLGIFIFLLGIVFMGREKVILWFQEEVDKRIQGENRSIFSQVIMDSYKEEAVEWVRVYREMEKLINLRQFNTALKTYSRINRDEDLPIEVKNKFYILSTFISPPHFDELVPITSFHNIDPEDLEGPIGLYYKLEFNVIQINKSYPEKFLIELIHPVPQTQSQIRDSFDRKRAILVSGDADENLNLKIGQIYESIAQLQTQERKYLVFSPVLVRSPVRTPSE